ncbi:hypothetical protein [Anaerophaga thermohalophila]|uniref:hypothetical protein n=1 Tax=Anaerophaga thermohalophila TaxID=177400 RepID=UPI0021002BEE|nr:hypothetical protein [Anaerophaga thermohalophila]
MRTHTSDPVPFLLIKPGEKPDSVSVFDEFSVKKGSLGLLKDGEVLQKLFS